MRWRLAWPSWWRAPSTGDWCAWGTSAGTSWSLAWTWQPARGATSFVQNLECTTPCLYNISFIQHLICTKLGYTTPHLYKTHFYNTSFVQHLGYTTLGYTTLESTILINVSLPDISLLKLFPLGRLRPTLAVLQNGSI